MIDPAKIPFNVTSFVRAVEQEVMRARDKFPGADHGTVALMEETGEASKAMLDESSAAVYKECVQTAAMACRLALEGDRSLDKHRRLKGLDPHGNAAMAHARLAELGMQRRHDPREPLATSVDRALDRARNP